MRKNRVVRFSDNEWAMLGAFAKSVGMSRAEHIRQACKSMAYPVGQKCELCFRPLPPNDYVKYVGTTVRGTGYAHAVCVMKEGVK